MAKTSTQLLVGGTVTGNGSFAWKVVRASDGDDIIQNGYTWMNGNDCTYPGTVECTPTF